MNTRDHQHGLQGTEIPCMKRAYLTTHMITARVKQQRETDTRTTAKEQHETWKEGIGDLYYREKGPKQGPTSAQVPDY